MGADLLRIGCLTVGEGIMQRKQKYATLEESGHTKVHAGAMMADGSDGDEVEVDLEMSVAGGGAAAGAAAADCH